MILVLMISVGPWHQLRGRLSRLPQWPGHRDGAQCQPHGADGDSPSLLGGPGPADSGAAEPLAARLPQCRGRDLRLAEITLTLWACIPMNFRTKNKISIRQAIAGRSNRPPRPASAKCFDQFKMV
jgi:hypothetical protein